MENNYNKLINNLDKLNLLTMKNYLNQYIDLSNNNKVSLIDALYNLTTLEINAKKERSDRAVITTAHFPYIKRFEDFDFDFQPELNKAEVLDLKYIEAATNGRSTYFITCHELCLQLKRAQLENRLENRLKHFFSYSLLIIDEVGYLPMDMEASNLLFQLISKRYEKKSTIITSNKPLNKWHEIFGDAVLANAILDRLLHHSKVITINGPSYRTKDYFVEK